MLNLGFIHIHCAYCHNYAGLQQHDAAAAQIAHYCPHCQMRVWWEPLDEIYHTDSKHLSMKLRYFCFHNIYPCVHTSPRRLLPNLLLHTQGCMKPRWTDVQVLENKYIICLSATVGIFLKKIWVFWDENGHKISSVNKQGLEFDQKIWFFGEVYFFKSPQLLLKLQAWIVSPKCMRVHFGDINQVWQQSFFSLQHK